MCSSDLLGDAEGDNVGVAGGEQLHDLEHRADLVWEENGERWRQREEEGKRGRKRKEDRR